MVIDLVLYATTVTGPSGRFHPAVRHIYNSSYAPWVWYSIDFADEDEAREFAARAVAEAERAANEIAQTWLCEPFSLLRLA